MNENRECSIIRDLIPLCSEGLCSEESRAAVEAHVQTCENCRRLYQQLPEEREPAVQEMPDAGSAFRKISRRMQRSRIRTALLLTLLLLLLLGLGYLTVGQIARTERIQSFETLWRNVEVYPIAKMIAEGDFEQLENYLSAEELDDLYTYKYIREIRAQDVENLKAAFQSAYGDTRVKSIKVHSTYAQMYLEYSSVIYSSVDIIYQNGETLGLDIYKGIDGLYRCVVGYRSSDGTADFQSAVDFANYHEIVPRGFTEILLTMEGMPPEPENRIEMIGHRFAPEYREALREGITAYLDAGYSTEQCTLTNTRYDEQRKMLYYAFTLTGKDDKGTALMTGRIYVDYRGMYPPAADDILIYENGCTGELTEALAHFFG